MLLHMPPNELLRIDELWAFVSVDDQGNEGLCAAPMGNFGSMPLIAADKKRLDSLIPIAKQVATMSGRTVRLIRLATREEIQEFRP